MQYHPEIGLLLNIDKDHDEITTLLSLFNQFRSQSRHFVVNQTHPLAASLSTNSKKDFIVDAATPTVNTVGYIANKFLQNGLQIQFEISGVPFLLEQVGKHNMENALAATAVAHQIGIPLTTAAQALKNTRGFTDDIRSLVKKMAFG